MKITTRILRLPLTLTPLLMVTPALAQTGPLVNADGAVSDFSVTGQLSMRYTDNVRKTDQNKESDIEQTLGLTAAYSKTTKALDIKASYNLKNTGYQDNSFDDEVWLSGVSSMVISTTPERYSWFISHQQSGTQLNSAANDTPDNRGEQSTITTGPNVNLKLSPVDVLAFNARHTLTKHSEASANDSSRNNASINWQHQLNSNHSFGVNANMSDVEFDERPTSDYKQTNLGGSFNGSFRRGSYQLAAGRSKNERTIGSDVDSSYANGQINYKVENGEWGLIYNKEITDTSVGLSLSDNYAGFDALMALSDAGDGASNQTDIVKRTRWQGYYQRKAANSRISLKFTLSQDDENFLTFPEDVRTLMAILDANYQASANLSASLSYKFQRKDYLQQSFINQDDINTYTLAVNHQFNERVSLNYQLAYERRDNIMTASREYDEFSASINVNYNFK